jgi:two-component system NtrC family sensor kinase
VRFDYRQHFPFRVRIRNKIVAPLVVIFVVVAVAGVTVVGDIFSARLRGLARAELRRGGRVVEEIIALRMRMTADLCRMAAEGIPPGAASPAMEARLSSDLAGYVPALVLTASGLPAGFAAVGTGPDEVRYGYRFDPDTGDLGLTAWAVCPRDRRWTLGLTERVEVPLLSSIRDQTGFEVILSRPGHRWRAETPGSVLLSETVLQREPALRPGQDTAEGSFEKDGRPWSWYAFSLPAGDRVAARCTLIRPDDDMASWRRAFLRDIALFFFVIAAGVIILYGFIVQQLTVPLRELMAAAGRVGRGDFSTEVRITSRDEIGALGEAFGRMTASLWEKRRELEEATQKIIHQEKLASLGQMVAGIVHEIRNPLNSLSLMINLDERASTEDEREICRRTMRADVTRIGRSVEQLLGLSRRPDMAPQAVDLNGCIRELAGRMSSLFESHGIEVVTTLDERIPLVMTGEGRLDQVLYNLMVNSLQAMRKGGILNVVTAPTFRGEIPRGLPGVRLTLNDTGVGISPENLDRIFDPFFTTKPPGEGTGLGLSIVKSVVEEIGGVIRVVSVVGWGTRIEIVIPGIPDSETDGKAAPAGGE